MEYSACIELLFSEFPFLERIEKAKESGFEAIEFWYWKDKDLKAIKSECEKYSLKISSFTGLIENQMVNPEESKKCIDEFKQSLKVAQSLNCKNLVLHVNTIMDDMTAKPVSSLLSDQEKMNNIILLINQIVPLAEKSNITLCLEPLNTIVDHMGYFLCHSKDAFNIIKEINSKNLKLLYDIYHMQIMGDNISSTLEDNIDLIGYIHIADVPGRHEPGSGKIDFENIYKKLMEIGYHEYIGFEYEPSRSTEYSLISTKKIFKF